MNDLLANEYSLLQNHFLPNSKLIEKARVNSSIKKKHDKPRTPYQRLLDSNELSDDIKSKLVFEHTQLNPFELKKNLELKLKKVFSLIPTTLKGRFKP